MKFFSEITKELYDSKDELIEAEAAVLESDIENVDDECICDDECSDCECDACENSNDEETPVPTRKELASKVDEAEKTLKQAQADYDIARQQVEELSKTYLESVDAIMNPAKKALAEAEKAKYNAIKAFNDSYGAYQVTYTGAKAAEEMIKSLKAIDRFGSLADTLFTDNWIKRWLF